GVCSSPFVAPAGQLKRGTGSFSSWHLFLPRSKNGGDAEDKFNVDSGETSKTSTKALRPRSTSNVQPGTSPSADRIIRQRRRFDLFGRFPAAIRPQICRPVTVCRGLASSVRIGGRPVGWI